MSTICYVSSTSSSSSESVHTAMPYGTMGSEPLNSKRERSMSGSAEEDQKPSQKRIKSLSDASSSFSSSEAVYLPRCPYGGGWSTIQREALTHLERCMNEGVGSALVMETGTGKTSVVIAAYQNREEDSGPMLVVCPKNTQASWARQLRDHFPEIQAHIILSTNSKRAETFAAIRADITSGNKTVVVGSFSQLSTGILQSLEDVSWSTICIDEHVMRNTITARMKAFASMRSVPEGVKPPHMVLLTATPYQNGLADIVIASMLIGNEHVLGCTLENTVKEIKNNIQFASLFNMSGGWVGLEELNKKRKESCRAFFNQVCQTFFFANRNDAPWKQAEFVIVGSDCRDEEDSWYDETFGRICRRAYQIVNKAQIQKDIRVYEKRLTRHKTLADRDNLGRPIPNDRICEIESEIKRWSTTLLEIDLHRKELNNLIDTDRGFTPAVADLFAHYLKHERGDRKAVVFATSVGIQAGFADLAESMDLRVARMTSKLSDKKRAKLIAEFQRGEYDIMVSGYFAKEGITLTAASDVVLFHQNTNPSEEIQAKGRIARHGQQADEIRYYHLVLPNTFCGRIFNASQVKKHRAEHMIKAFSTGDWASFSKQISSDSEKQIEIMCQLKVKGLAMFYTGDPPIENATIYENESLEDHRKLHAEAVNIFNSVTHWFTRPGYSPDETLTHRMLASPE